MFPCFWPDISATQELARACRKRLEELEERERKKKEKAEKVIHANSSRKFPHTEAAGTRISAIRVNLACFKKWR